MAGSIRQNLHLEVLRRIEVAFEKHELVCKRRCRFPSSARQGGRKLISFPHQTHAFAAAPRRGLDEQGITDLGRRAGQGLIALIRFLIAGHDGRSRRGHYALRFDL